MSTKRLQISCGQFGELSQDILADLRNDNDFLDVTLVCDGDKQIQAHKVVLASFSSFFKSLLRNNPHQHPLIYLKGLDMEDLQAIITFIYTGEVSISEEPLIRSLKYPGTWKLRDFLKMTLIQIRWKFQENKKSSITLRMITQVVLKIVVSTISKTSTMSVMKQSRRK